MKPIVAVAVSGGIDSLMAAYLLDAAGLAVRAVHFVTGFERDERFDQKVVELFRPLGIPVDVLDCRARFKAEVVDYFTASYLEGKTPNPCVVCNAAIKFGYLLEVARRLGAGQLATGHYARIDTGTDGRPRLRQAADLSKDQSYFLARLAPAQLAMARFPLGELTKQQVLALADQAGLRAIRHKESQDICFIGQDSYGQFLAQMGAPAGPGPIVTTDGRTIGTHQGLYRFTIGQRRGINCPDARPYYVVGIDRPGNRLIVGRPADLLRPSCRVSRINWLDPPSAHPLRIKARIRYRSPAADAVLRITGPDAAQLCFDRPQSAVTPGQAAVFYRGENVIGGGWIEA